MLLEPSFSSIFLEDHHTCYMTHVTIIFIFFFFNIADRLMYWKLSDSQQQIIVHVCILHINIIASDSMLSGINTVQVWLLDLRGSVHMVG